MNGPGTHSPRRLAVLIVAVTVVPLVAFVWLGWRLGAQERAIEAQRRRERVELSAERVVAAVERAVSSSERALAAGQRQWSEGAVAVTF